MGRHKDANWDCGPPDRVASIDHAILATLMDLRDELKEANRYLRSIDRTLACHNVVKGMQALQRIDKRAAKHWPIRPKRKR